MKAVLLVGMALLLLPTRSVSTDIRFARATTIKAIEFWAASSERPGPIERIREAWSPYDHRDSVVIRAVVEAGKPTPKALLVATLEYLAGRRVWTDKSHETVDIDRVHKNAVWLPASAAFQLPLSKARRSTDGSLVLDLGVIAPARAADSLQAYDPELLVVGLRVTARLIAKDVSTASTVGRIDVASGD